MTAIQRALAPESPPAQLLIIEGPAGSGRTTMLRAAAAMATRAGLAAGRVHGDGCGGQAIDDVARALLEAAPAGPTLLCVDELQWLDDAVLQRLHELLVTTTTRIVAAVRCGAAPVVPRRLATLRACAAQTVALTPLHRQHVRTILRSAGVSGDARLPDSCLELTAGNPALLRVLVDHLAASDQPLGSPTLGGPLLGDVARIGTREIAHHGPDAQALVDAALVLAEDSSLWLVARLAGLSMPHAATIADALVAGGLLASADPVRLAAPLMRAALDATAARAARDELHRQAALLLARTSDGLEPAADHLVSVPPGGEAQQAEILRDAAQVAATRGDHALAAARLRRGLEEPLDPTLRGQLLVELGTALERGGVAGSADAYRQALRVVEAEQRPSVHLRLGRTQFGAGDYRAAAAEFDRGLSMLGDDEPLAVELIAGYVAAARFDGALAADARERLAPLLDRSTPGRTAAERALLAEIALERGIGGAPRNDVVALALRAWADGQLLGNADAYGIVLSQLAAVLTWSDAFAESEQILSAALAQAERDGEAHAAATARYLRAWPRYYRGALADAEADVRFALTGPVWEMYEPSARAVLAHLRIEAGDPAGARDAVALEDAEPWRQTAPYALLLEARARLHVLSGDLDAASTDLAAGGAVLETMGSRHPFCPWRSRLGLVTARQGDAEAGRRLIEQELDQAREIGLSRAQGVALHARALLRAAGGDDPQADLREAAEALEQCEARLDLARVLTDLGWALTEAERRRAARTQLREALRIAEALGAVEIAERARRELARSGGRAERPAPAAPAGLTASELRVARLAARGQTNRQIAEELVVTPHTVRFHLGNAYRKLGVSGRDQLSGALDGRDASAAGSRR